MEGVHLTPPSVDGADPSAQGAMLEGRHAEMCCLPSVCSRPRPRAALQHPTTEMLQMARRHTRAISPPRVARNGKARAHVC